MPGPFSDEVQRELQRSHRIVCNSFRLVPGDLLAHWLPTLKSDAAQEYLKHGVSRRMRVVARAVERIFDLCPPDRVELLDSNERCDVEINLHAFVINVHGLLDNLAWITVHERSPGTLPPRREVSLFKNGVKRLLSEEGRAYLSTHLISNWHARYAREYRDALAHRIPLYVPPAFLVPSEQRRYAELEREFHKRMAEGDAGGAGDALRQQDQVGALFPAFLQSLRGEGAASPVYFHPQLIADSRTVLEIVRVVSPVKLPELEHGRQSFAET